MNSLTTAALAVRAVMVVSLITVCSVAIATQPTQKPSPAALTGPGSLAGLWTFTNYKGSRLPGRQRVLQTVDGKMPPLLPWASEMLEKRIELNDKGEPFANTLTQCLPGGMPEMLFGASYPVQIIESPGQVTMLFEEQNHFRIIHLNGSHPDDPDPSYMGHSTGRWQGDILVVDTVGLTDHTTIDQIGMPHSEALHLIERFRRVDRNTLEIVVTIDDAKTFSRPWDARAVYRIASAETTMSEYICENNRNAVDSNGGTGFQVPAAGR